MCASRGVEKHDASCLRVRIVKTSRIESAALHPSSKVVWEPAFVQTIESPGLPESGSDRSWIEPVHNSGKELRPGAVSVPPRRARRGTIGGVGVAQMYGR